MVFFALLAIAMMALPAYAQGGSAAAPGGANWVALLPDSHRHCCGLAV